MRKIKNKWLLSVACISVLSIGLMGCGDANDTQTGDPDTGDKIEDTGSDAKDSVDDGVKEAEDEVRDMTYEDIKIKPEEAFDKYMELHPDSKLTKVDLDKELMEYQYVIEGYDATNEHEVKLNPVDGEIVSDDTEEVDVEDKAGEITKEHLAKIDSIIDKAKEEDASDSKLDEWTVYVEDGKVIIDVEIGATKYSYDMDTEEIIKD